MEESPSRLQRSGPTECKECHLHDGRNREERNENSEAPWLIPSRRGAWLRAGGGKPIDGASRARIARPNNDPYRIAAKAISPSRRSQVVVPHAPDRSTNATRATSPERPDAPTTTRIRTNVRART